MYKILLALVTLTLLASCTQIPETPAVTMDDKKIMTGSDMMKTDTMNDDKKMMDDDMMPGSDMMKDDMMKPEAMLDDKMMSGAMDDKKMMDDDMMKKDDAMMKPSGYMNYDEAKVSEALTSGQKVALFFHATWCPSCKALDKVINSSLSSIPADTLILKVDYDTSTDLKKKYRVVGQHTTVILGADGTEKSKKLGARTVAEVLN